MSTHRWKYFGDIDERCGGMWVRPTDDGCADVIRITPCADAGGPENLYWVEILTVYGLDEEDKRRDVENSVGWNMENASTHKWAEAFVIYGYYDPANCYPSASSEIVQVGKTRDEYCRDKMEHEKTTVLLHGNASIKRYARRLAAERC